MTLNEISRKLFRNNRKQYGLFFFSVVFGGAMTGAYGVLQYSPAVTEVLVDGGSTQTISQSMFFGSMLGIAVFLVYADSIFLKYKSCEIGIFLSLGIDRRGVQRIIIREYTTRSFSRAPPRQVCSCLSHLLIYAGHFSICFWEQGKRRSVSAMQG